MPPCVFKLLAGLDTLSVHGHNAALPSAYNRLVISAIINLFVPGAPAPGRKIEPGVLTCRPTVWPDRLRSSLDHYSLFHVAVKKNYSRLRQGPACKSRPEVQARSQQRARDGQAIKIHCRATLLFSNFLMVIEEGSAR